MCQLIAHMTFKRAREATMWSNPMCVHLRMAPPCKNPMKTHMQRRSWSTDRHHTHCRRPCDLGHGHGKTSQSGPSTRHNCPRQQRRSGSRIKQTRGRTTKRHRNAKKSTLSCVSQGITTSENLARRSIPVVLQCCNPH